MNIRNLFPSLIAALTAFFLGVSPAAAAPDPESARIYMVELWVHTCDVKNAGTDDRVSVRLDELHGQRFYLDQPGDDRERDDWNYYQVRIDDVRRLNEIQRIQLDIDGGDGWCFDQIWLSVNGDIVYQWSGDGQWIDKDDTPTHKIFSSTLRKHAYWPKKGDSSSPQICRAPKILGKGDMYDLLTGIIGDRITKPDDPKIKNLQWRDSGATLARRDENSWKLDIKLWAEVKDYYDADISATYDIDVSCSNKSLIMKPRLRNSNVKFNIPWYVTVLTGGIVNMVNAVIDSSVEKRLKEDLEDISETFDAPALLCPSIEIDSSANLNLGWPSVVGTKPVLCQ